MEGGKDADKGPAMYGSSPALAQKHKAGGLGASRPNQMHLLQLAAPVPVIHVGPHFLTWMKGLPGEAAPSTPPQLAPGPISQGPQMERTTSQPERGGRDFRNNLFSQKEEAGVNNQSMHKI